MNRLEYQNAMEKYESNSDYLEKMALDKKAYLPSAKNHKKAKQRDNSWVRDRAYKKKLVRKFLSINPSMNYSLSPGMRCEYAIYMSYPHTFDGKYVNHRFQYVLNPYTKIFASEHGDLRKCNKGIAYERGNLSIYNIKLNQSKITNRRIRKIPIDDETSYKFSYCKKKFGPYVDNGW